MVTGGIREAPYNHQTTIVIQAGETWSQANIHDNLQLSQVRVLA